MSHESQLVAACARSREAYELMQMHCSLREFGPFAQHWLRQIGAYYDRDNEAGSTDVKLLRELGLSNSTERHREALAEYFDSLPFVGVSATNVLAAVLLHKRQQAGLLLADKLVDPEADTSTLREELDTYRELLDISDRGFTALRVLDRDSVDSLYDAEKVIPLYPRQLAGQCLGGGALPGHHLLIYGRPEAGKSLFSINMAAGMAYHGKRVLYFGNEENIKLHYVRMCCNLARANIDTFQERQKEIVTLASERGVDNVEFIELIPGTLAEIEEGIKMFRPDAVFVDQLAGVEVGETNPVRAMDKAARGFRTLCLKYGIVGVSVAQAGDRTERHGQLPPAFLTMGDVYGSRTGLPAQCDLMLGIGFDQDMYDRNVRGVSLPKNKLGQHDSFKVRILPQQSRVVSMGDF